MTGILPVVLDAMGGDRAPEEIIAGARIAAEAHGIPVLLVGQPDVLARFDVGDLPVVAASEVVTMHDDPAGAVRRKKDSSVVRAAEAVRDGRASAMVSAGNTGATMAAALLRMGRIRGVARPAVATPIPVPGAAPTTLLDAGANAECAPEWLVQFAQMGTVYARHRFGIDEPRVGLLSIGEEPGKGNALVKEAYSRLADASGVRFLGNVEGRDIMTDDVDVVVTDGFTGNVVLKTLEGGMKAALRAMEDAFAVKPEYEASAAVLAPALEPLYEVLDAETYGGAMLLGVDGACVISHGSSSARAIVNALAVAREMVEVDLVGRLRDAIG